MFAATGTLLAGSFLCVLALPGRPSGQESSPREQAGDPLQAELDQLVERYQQAEKELSEAVRAAKTDEERSRIWEEKSPAGRFVPEFAALAEKAGRTDTGARAWIWVVRLGPRAGGEVGADDAPAVKGLEALTRDHIGSPHLVELATELRYAGWSLGQERCERALRAMIDRSPHDAVKAEAMFVLAATLAQERGRKAGADASAGERRKEARALFERLKKEHSTARRPRGGRYADVVERFLYEIDHLQIGQAAPDFEATDQDGARFKLSDYRGKVVVLDFWGMW